MSDSRATVHAACSASWPQAPLLRCLHCHYRFWRQAPLNNEVQKSKTPIIGSLAPLLGGHIDPVGCRPPVINPLIVQARADSAHSC